eukprot:6311889-Pyramimonas_sp.AAC.2
MQDGIKEVSSSGGLPSKPSLKQHAHESITASCANQLDKAAYIYGDYTNLEKQRLILAVLTPTQTYHGRWDGVESLPFRCFFAPVHGLAQLLSSLSSSRLAILVLAVL